MACRINWTPLSQINMQLSKNTAMHVQVVEKNVNAQEIYCNGLKQFARAKNPIPFLNNYPRVVQNLGQNSTNENIMSPELTTELLMFSRAFRSCTLKPQSLTIIHSITVKCICRLGLSITRGTKEAAVEAATVPLSHSQVYWQLRSTGAAGQGIDVSYS